MPMPPALHGQLARHREHSRPLVAACARAPGTRRPSCALAEPRVDDGAAAARLQVRPRRLAGEEDDVELADHRLPPVRLVVHDPRSGAKATRAAAFTRTCGPPCRSSGVRHERLDLRRDRSGRTGWTPPTDRPSAGGQREGLLRGRRRRGRPRPRSAPSRANVSAQPRPMPLPLPVTMATLPARRSDTGPSSRLRTRSGPFFGPGLCVTSELGVPARPGRCPRP